MTSLSGLARHRILSAPNSSNSRIFALAIVLAVMLMAAALPDGAVSHLLYAQSPDSSIEYAENGKARVAVFLAHDQDGDVIRWSLSGSNAHLFTIGGGVLAFKQPPNFEDPQSAIATGPLEKRNVYNVTIEAAGAVHEVAVTVRDVDEPGTVSIDRPQPQVDRPLQARLFDEDYGVTGARWQWARSVDGTSWTDIPGAISPRRSPASADEGTYLRATATYSDKFGAGKTASAVSENRVEAKTLSNAAPSFADQDDDKSTLYIDILRSVAENTAVGMPVGVPVSASDADDDLLFYEFVETPDLIDADGQIRFTIERDSGQIRTAKVLGADSGEREDEDSRSLIGNPPLPEGINAGEADNSEYLLRVMVSDPSTATSTVNVTIRVTDVNEPPQFDEDAPSVLRVVENADPPLITFGDDNSPVSPDLYSVTDRDVSVSGPNSYDDTTYSYTLSGPDSDFFEFDTAGALSLIASHKPDFEEKNSYSVTIEASSGEGSRRLTNRLNVAIKVVDAEDVGKVELSQREPQVGRQVRARVSDPDGGIRIKGWEWERSSEITLDSGGAPSAECRDDPGTPGIDEVGGWTSIDGASLPFYTPKLGDADRCLRVTVTYTDNIKNPVDASAEQIAGTVEAPVQRRSPVNSAPRFVVQSGRTIRRVAENTVAGQDIGSPVSAHDEDGELLIYTLGGSDAASFSLTRNNGQLKTKVPLDYESKRRYTVEVIATDPSGASDSILVTIRLTNENDPAQLAGRSSVIFSENKTVPVTTYFAYDEDGSAIKWSLSGRDANLFTIHGGELAFKTPPNYEDPLSVVDGVPRAERNVYRLTVEASGSSKDVVVTVTDVDESGMVTISRPQPQVSRPLYARLLDEDNGVAGENWQWARSGTGTVWTDIEGATSPLRSPAPDDVGRFLRARVTYTDKFGNGKSASGVSSNRVEAKTLSNEAPSFAGQDEDWVTPYIEIVRSVAENAAEGTAIGEPVSASDEDEDILFYELLDTPDLRADDGHVRFTIDSETGQIRVVEILGADAGEREDEESRALDGQPALPEGEDAGEADNSEYVLRVRASDPSTASVTVNAIVKITDVNEPPAFHVDAPTLLMVSENLETPLLTFGNDETVDADTYAVTDQDGSVAGPDGHDDTAYTYSVSGADRSSFTFNGAGVLSFRAGREPDYEQKSSYSITIEARSGEGSRRMTARLDVVIEVVNTHDLGEVQMSQRQPQVGIEIVATLSDPDGGVIITRWVWERTVDDDLAPSAKCEDIEADEVWMPIGEASSAVYVPKSTDVGRCLRATAVYMDNLDDTELEATGVLEVPARGARTPASVPLPPSVNAAPEFPDQDLITEGNQSDGAIRQVAENTESGQNIGAPVSAYDDDGDLLIYTLQGEDASHFRILRRSGQLRTRSPLNYEDRNTYTVIVTATDPLGASDSIEVTINVTDEDDPPIITVNTDI